MKVSLLNWKLTFVVFLSVTTTACIHVTDAANILGIFPWPAPSHNIVFQALMRALAEKGHRIEVASPYSLPPPKVKNYTDVKLPIPKTDQQTLMKSIINSGITPLQEHFSLWNFPEMMCEVHLASPEMQKYLSPDYKEKFDLVIVETFFFDCMVGFAHRFDAPMIGIVSQYALAWAYDAVGAPNQYSFVPNTFMRFGERMNFWERLHNTVFSISMSLYRRYISLPKQNEIAKKFFGPDVPPIWEIENKRTSLIFMNGHPVVSPIHPSMPNLVDVGGMHILAEPPPLPKDIQEILDKGGNIILFSLGSVISSQTIMEERLITLLNAMKDMPCKVLWRWDGDTDKLPIPLPSNVHASKWLPQQSILAHPNLSGFFTHGGLLSIQEATYHGIPVVGFPFYGDQYLNLIHAKEVGLGFSLNFHTFTKDDLVDAANEILHNESYKINAKKASAIFRDQQETPLERGVYWTEYIIRHKGAPHLRSAAMDLTWYQYNLVDIILFLLMSVVAIIVLLYYVIVFLKSLLFGSKEKRD